MFFVQQRVTLQKSTSSPPQPWATAQSPRSGKGGTKVQEISPPLTRVKKPVSRFKLKGWAIGLSQRCQSRQFTSPLYGEDYSRWCELEKIQKLFRRASADLSIFPATRRAACSRPVSFVLQQRTLILVIRGVFPWPWTMRFSFPF